MQSNQETFLHKATRSRLGEVGISPNSQKHEQNEDTEEYAPNEEKVKIPEKQLKEKSFS